MEKLITLKEASERLGSKDPKGRYVRNLRSKGILEGVKFGNRLMLTESSVNEFIESEIRKQNKRVSLWRNTQRSLCFPPITSTSIISNYAKKGIEKYGWTKS